MELSIGSTGGGAYSAERLLDAIPGGKFQLTLKPSGELSFEYVSPSFYELYGITPAEFAENPSCALSKVHPEDLPRLTEANIRTFQGQVDVTVEYRVSIDNTWRWILARSQSRAGPDGALVCCGYLLDVTEQKLAEERAEKARQSALAAEAASAAKSRFLANVSHELRTPLNAIIGFSELIAENLHDGPAQRDLARVTNAAARLVSLVDDLIDLAQIESGDTRVAISSFDAAQLLRSAVAEAQQRHGNLDIHTHAERNAGSLRSDERLAARCVKKLLHHACQHAAKTVSVALSWIDDEVRYTVESDGELVADLDALFEPFNESDSSTQQRGGVTGLELCVARDTARLLGGAVWLEARNNSYASHLTLPNGCLAR